MEEDHYRKKINDKLLLNSYTDTNYHLDNKTNRKKSFNVTSTTPITFQAS
jgi:hypothetical protein